MSSSISRPEDVLAHHGVKGMKWGIRRSRKSSGSSQTGPKKQESRKASSLSDAELQRLVNRANLERQYKQAYGPKPSQRSRLKKQLASLPGDIAVSAIRNVGTKYATNYLDSAVSAGVKASKKRKKRG